MLVLKRRPGESLLIGDDVEVKVLGVSGHQVSIGINAPEVVKILRGGVKKRDENDEQ